MSQGSKTSQELVDIVVELRRKGRSHRRIVDELKARGTPLSLGAVHRIAPAKKTKLVEVGPAPKRRPPARPKRTVEEVTELMEAPPAGANIDFLESLLADAKEMQQAVKTDGNVADLVRLMSAASKLVDHIDRLRPAPPKNYDDQPDMVEAARAGTTKLHGLLGNILGEPPRD